MKLFKRMFVPNYNYRFSVEQLETLADDVVFVCECPMFDDLLGEDQAERFEGRIVNKMKNFDPQNDCIAFYGDVMVFALMVYFVGGEHEEFSIARFSSKRNEYVVRKIKDDLFAQFEEK